MKGFLWLILLLLAAIAFAAQPSYELTLCGRVYDSNGAVVPGASVSVTGSDGLARKAKADLAGKFELLLPRGTYDVLIEHPQFQTYKIEGFSVSVNCDRGTLNVEMKARDDHEACGVSGADCWPLPAPDLKTRDPVSLPSIRTRNVFCGVVRDELTASIPNARIKAIKKNSSQIYEAKTNEDGYFNLGLPEGVYTITFRMDGFKKKTLKDYSIPTRCVDIELTSAVKPHNIS